MCETKKKKNKNEKQPIFKSRGMINKISRSSFPRGVKQLNGIGKEYKGQAKCWGML